MKSTVLTLLSFITGLAVFGQQEFPGKVTVTGDVSSFASSGTLSILYTKLDRRIEFDSTIIKDGRFAFEKELKEPMVVTISFLTAKAKRERAAPDFYSFYLVPGTAVLTTKGSLRESVLTGDVVAVNKEYHELSGKVQDYYKKHNSIVGRIAKSDEKRRRFVSDSIMKRLEEEVFKAFVADNPESPVAEYALLEYAMRPLLAPRKRRAPEEIEGMVMQLSKKNQEIPTIHQLKEELKASITTGPGKSILDFTLTDTEGKQVRLSDFSGKYVLLDFWASYCAPCRKENPLVLQQFNKYRNKGFTVLSVSLDEPGGRQAWLNAIRQDGLGEWTHVSDLKGMKSEVARLYYIKGIPTNFLISPDGKFLDRDLHGKELGEKLEALLH